MEKQKGYRVQYKPTGKNFPHREKIQPGGYSMVFSLEKVEEIKRQCDKHFNTMVTKPAETRKNEETGEVTILTREKRVRQECVVIWVDEYEQDWNQDRERWGPSRLVKNNEPKTSYKEPKAEKLEEFEVEDKKADEPEMVEA